MFYTHGRAYIEILSMITRQELGRSSKCFCIIVSNTSEFIVWATVFSFREEPFWKLSVFKASAFQWDRKAILCFASLTFCPSHFTLARDIDLTWQNVNIKVTVVYCYIRHWYICVKSSYKKAPIFSEYGPDQAWLYRNWDLWLLYLC